MAVIKAVNSKASIGRAINYITKGEKTEEKLISGKNCNPHTAIDEMKATKEQWGKTGGRQYKHYIQSFNPDDKITPEKAHEIGRKLIDSVENFKGYEVVIATHVDKGHIHNHFIVNSVSFENGMKFQQSKQDLAMLKDHSDRLCEREGLSTIKEKGNEITAFDQKKYRAIEKGFNGKGQSYLLDTAKDVIQSLKKATDRESFIKAMESKGYKVEWKDTRKYITFTTPEGKRVRNNNLEETFKEHRFSKEGMEGEIQRNFERARRIDRGISADRNRGIPVGKPSTPNVDWTAVRNTLQSEGNRISKQPSHDVVGEIQCQVRRIKERTDRAIGQSKPKDKPTSTLQRDIEPKPREASRESKQRVRERDFDLER